MGAALIFAGRFFGDIIHRNQELLHWMGHVASVVFVLVVVIWFLYRVWKKWSILRQVKLRGIEKVDWLFVFSCAAHNLLRLPRLMAQPPETLREQCA